jgi:Na+-translocating ferredoxin:NAD+ oxidoreductase RnfD subunit
MIHLNKVKKEETQKALKWIIRSGAVTTFLIGLVTLLTGLQTDTIDYKFAVFGFLILVINAIVNLIDYYTNQK